MESNDVENHLACPICFEIPRHEIIQCKIGHHVCKGCRRSLSNCPQCRIPYGKEDIRNLAMESLLDSMEFPCPFKGEGCPAKVPRKDLDSHGNSCKFNPATKLFCSRHLGWKSCDAAVDESSILSHLEKHHPVQKINCSTFQLGLQYHEKSWIGYFMVTSLSTPILLRAVVSGPGFSVLTCFMFRDTEMADVKRFRVKCRIELNEEAEIEWSGLVQPYREIEEANYCNSFCIPVLTQTGKRVDSAQAVDRLTSMKIKIAIYKATHNAPRLKTGDFQIVNISEQMYLVPPDGQSPMVVSSGGTCDVCNLGFIRNWYMCLQCPNYTLCSRCVGLGHHNQHIFVRLLNTSQGTTFLTNFWRTYSSIGQNINN